MRLVGLLGTWLVGLSLDIVGCRGLSQRRHCRGQKRERRLRGRGSRERGEEVRAAGRRMLRREPGHTLSSFSRAAA